MLTPPAALEALLFASGEPLAKTQLVALLEIKPNELDLAVSALHKELIGRGIALIETAGELELRTVPGAAELVKKFRESELARDLGKASLETLAAIAYKAVGADNGGGATRGEVDWVRGVNSSTSIRTLLLRGLIEGREDERDKRRVRYALTTEALAHLGISRIEELPRYREFATSVVSATELSEAAE